MGVACSTLNGNQRVRGSEILIHGYVQSHVPDAVFLQPTLMVSLPAALDAKEPPSRLLFRRQFYSGTNAATVTFGTVVADEAAPFVACGFRSTELQPSADQG